MDTNTNITPEEIRAETRVRKGRLLNMLGKLDRFDSFAIGWSLACVAITLERVVR